MLIVAEDVKTLTLVFAILDSRSTMLVDRYFINTKFTPVLASHMGYNKMNLCTFISSPLCFIFGGLVIFRSVCI